jgi:membrane fusion protein (multidrug efflux system)
MRLFINKLKSNRVINLSFFATFIILVIVCLNVNLGLADVQSAPMVKVAKVKVENVNQPEKFIGHVESIERVEIIARVAGYLEKVNFNEGSFIKAGKLLYIIEQPPYIAKVSANEGLVKQAKADVFKANQKLTRLLTAQPESVPATDLDDARAQKNYAEGVLREAEANLKLSKIDLGYTTIIAPITGRIGKTTYTKGNFVGPSSKPLAEIVQMDPIRVVFSVSENNIVMIEKSLKGTKDNRGKYTLSPEIEFPNGLKYSLKGKIEFIDNKVDPQTGTIAIWANFRNPDGYLIPGEYVTVFLPMSEPKLMPIIPQVAVMQDSKGDFVYVLNSENKVEERRIKTDAIIGDKLAVKSGLKEGDIIIIEGIQKVHPGIKVNASSVDVEAQ